MATTILTPGIDGASFILTSSVSSIRARTTDQSVDVELSCDAPDGSVDIFFATTLYAFDGIVELTDIGSLIEQYFRSKNKVADTVEIAFDSATISAKFLYCEYFLPEAFYPAKSFFVAAPVQRVHQDSVVAIAAVDKADGTPFVIKLVGHKADGTIATLTKSELRTFNAEHTTYFSMADLLEWATDTEDSDKTPLVDILYLSINYGDIQKVLYITPAEAYLTFSFRNIFNVEEFVDVAGILATKTEVERDSAVCSGITRQYNRQVTRTYDIQSEPLTTAEVAIFEQFLASHQVKMYLEGNDYDVIITDHTCEPSSDDEALTTVKFSWQFADRRPRIFDHEFNGILPTRRKIFTPHFSAEYE